MAAVPIMMEPQAVGGAQRAGVEGIIQPYPMGVAANLVAWVVQATQTVLEHPYDGIRSKCLQCMNPSYANPAKHLVCRKSGGWPPPLDRWEPVEPLSVQAAAQVAHRLAAPAAVWPIVALGPVVAVPVAAPVAGDGGAVGGVAALGGVAAPLAVAPGGGGGVGVGGAHGPHVFVPLAFAVGGAAGPLLDHERAGMWAILEDAASILLAQGPAALGPNLDQRCQFLGYITSNTSQAFWSLALVRHWVASCGVRVEEGPDGAWRLFAHAPDGSVPSFTSFGLGVAAASAKRLGAGGLAAVAGAGGGAPVHVGGPIVPPLPAVPADAPVVKDFPVGAPFGSVETLVRDGLPSQKYVLTTCVERLAIPIPWDTSKANSASSSFKGLGGAAAAAGAAQHDPPLLSLRCGLRLRVVQDNRFVASWIRTRGTVVWPTSRILGRPDSVLQALACGRLPLYAELRGPELRLFNVSESRLCLTALGALVGRLVLPRDVLYKRLETVMRDFDELVAPVEVDGVLVSQEKALKWYWKSWDSALRTAHAWASREAAALADTLQALGDKDAERLIITKQFHVDALAEADMNIGASMRSAHNLRGQSEVARDERASVVAAPAAPLVPRREPQAGICHGWLGTGICKWGRDCDRRASHTESNADAEPWQPSVKKAGSRKRGRDAAVS